MAEEGCLGCWRCEDTVVTLNDGRKVCPQCPDFKNQPVKSSRDELMYLMERMAKKNARKSR